MESNQAVSDSIVQSSQGSGRRQSQTTRAEKIRRATQRLVKERVIELLGKNPEWLRGLGQEKAARHHVHISRLRITKKTHSLRSLQEKITQLDKALFEDRADEKRYGSDLAGIRLRKAVLTERMTAKVRAELGIAELSDLE